MNEGGVEKEPRSGDVREVGGVHAHVKKERKVLICCGDAAPCGWADEGRPNMTEGTRRRIQTKCHRTWTRPSQSLTLRPTNHLSP